MRDTINWFQKIYQKLKKIMEKVIKIKQIKK